MLLLEGLLVFGMDCVQSHCSLPLLSGIVLIRVMRFSYGMIEWLNEASLDHKFPALLPLAANNEAKARECFEFH